MVFYTSAQSNNELEGILALQKANLPSNLTQEEMESQGFVTVVHSLNDLRHMNDIEPHIIAKDDDKVVAYLLAMTSASKEDIAVLKPMFKIFENIQFSRKPVSSYQYIVVGQVCVDKNFRGQGVLDNCYFAYKNAFRQKYEFAITEIASRNTRSINAHKRIGFTHLHQYTAPDGEEWSIIVWKWREGETLNDRHETGQTYIS